MAKTKSTPNDYKDKVDTKNVDSEEKQTTSTKDSVKPINEDIDIEQEVLTETDPSEASQNDLAAERDKYLRLAAEYDNFRKRSAKEREMTYSNARIDVITKLLPVYDNLERALKMECADESFYKGVEMIMTGLLETLSDMGVQLIPAIGEPFDPNRHNAVMSIEDPNLGENIIAEEYQKGFILGDRVIRFSTVVVAN